MHKLSGSKERILEISQDNLNFRLFMCILFEATMNLGAAADSEFSLCFVRLKNGDVGALG